MHPSHARFHTDAMIVQPILRRLRAHLLLLPLLLVAACDTAEVEERPAGPAFDLIVSSGSLTGGGAGGVLRFDGRTGAYLGPFAVEDPSAPGGLVDPRDVVLDGLPLAPGTTVLVNTADFNNPAAPPNGAVRRDGVLRYRADGARLGAVADFLAAGEAPVAAGGAVFGPRGNYYVGSRARGTVLEVDARTGAVVGPLFDRSAVEFPRGFVFGPDGALYIGNGSRAPADGGTGGGSILRVGPDGAVTALVDNTAEPATGAVRDAGLSPLDVILTPDGSGLVVSSEFPFGSPDAVATVRIYDRETGALRQVLGLDADGEPRTDAGGSPLLQAPRGLGFGPDGRLYASSTGTGTVLRFAPIGFGYAFEDVLARFEGLNGQALNFVPAR